MNSLLLPLHSLTKNPIGIVFSAVVCMVWLELVFVCAWSRSDDFIHSLLTPHSYGNQMYRMDRKEQKKSNDDSDSNGNDEAVTIRKRLA